MEDNDTLIKEISNYQNIRVETLFLLLTMSRLEFKIGKFTIALYHIYKHYHKYQGVTKHISGPITSCKLNLTGESVSSSFSPPVFQIPKIVG